MASSPIFSSMPLSFLLVLQVITSKITSTEACKVRHCSRSGPPIRFPFRIRELHGKECGYEGFEVSCDDRNRTILHLSGAEDFVVDTIDYTDQYILVKDPNDCLPKRLLEDRFMSASSPFLAPDYKSLALANCSSAISSTIGPESSIMRLDCLGLARHTVVVGVMDYDSAQSWMWQHHCDYLATITSPWWPQRPTTINESFWLRWFQPDCTSCEAAKMRCELRYSKSGWKVTCMRKHGLSMGAQFAIASLFMLPWLACIFGFAWFFKVRAFGGLGLISPSNVPGSAPSNDVHGEAVEMARRNVVGKMGISSPAIESYPKTQIDEPGQLPRPNDDVCTICLSKYERKEMIRTFPSADITSMHIASTNGSGRMLLARCAAITKGTPRPRTQVIESLRTAQKRQVKKRKKVLRLQKRISRVKV